MTGLFEQEPKKGSNAKLILSFFSSVTCFMICWPMNWPAMFRICVPASLRHLT